jgi:HTH-type transcriptional regulator / antitoxin HigA
MGSKAGRKSQVQPAEAKTISRRSHTARTEPDTYLALVIEFPLIPIRDDDHLAEASAVLDQLLQQDLDGGQRDYLEVLTDLVEKYEEKHVRIPDASESDVLRELMRSHGLSQNALRARTGIAQSTISAVLNGERSLTKQQVVTLADHFGISPSAFMPVQSLAGRS